MLFGFRFIPYACVYVWVGVCVSACPYVNVLGNVWKRIPIPCSFHVLHPAQKSALDVKTLPRQSTLPPTASLRGFCSPYVCLLIFTSDCRTGYKGPT